MKQSRSTGWLLYAAIAFFSSSCGGSADEKTTVTDTTAADTTATTAAAAPVINTIVTTPENMVIVKHKVANYAKWLTNYDGHDSARLANGVHSYVVGRGLQDSNMVLVALKIDDVTKAKAFVKAPGLKAAMQKGGVVGAPVISFVTNTWQDTATIDSKIRSMSAFTVKDWDAWQKGYEEGKQDRIDNGIASRVIGHDLDNDKKVHLVTALMDTAKAFAYFKSDALKKRRAASGVIDEPVRFVFRIVKRY